jgi:hypothetical protein
MILNGMNKGNGSHYKAIFGKVIAASPHRCFVQNKLLCVPISAFAITHRGYADVIVS